MDKICFIITTFGRDELLYKSVESLIPYIQDNWKILIIDQGNNTKEKTKWINDIRFNKPDLVHYRCVEFNSGLSYCRNFGVQKAKEFGCKYCVIGSDSFLFDESILHLDAICCHNYNLIGFELYGCKCGWEAKLNLIERESFELDFIDKSTPQVFYDIDICRNFFVATTDSLLDSPWDNDLKLGEHEDFFYRYKLANYKCIWSNFISGTKMADRPNEYAKIRKENFDNGIKYLREKWNIKGWVSYKNLDRAKEGL